MRVEELLREGQRHLAVQGVAQAGLDARLLYGFVAELSHEQIIATGRDDVKPGIAELFSRLIKRRISGEPVAQILGTKEFWGLTFHVNRDVLSPRADSETLIEMALEMLSDMPPRTIIDVGTGTGCLLAALLCEFPEAKGWALDISGAALQVAQQNMQRLDLAERCTFLQKDFCQPVVGCYDLVISNPPYIRLDERASLPVEVRVFEPAEALFAGVDGLDAYRALCLQLPKMLTPERGNVIFELGQGQEKAVTALLEGAFVGLSYELSTRKDLSGIVRALGLRVAPFCEAMVTDRA